MKLGSLLLALIFSFLTPGWAKADSCQYTFKCKGIVCEKVQLASCSNDTSTNAVVVSTPPAAASIGVVTATNPPATPFVARNTQEVINQGALQSTPISGVGCAENGSCYGDISNINGMPKTNHVNGYFRSDGTYVRGHFRSSGRR